MHKVFITFILFIFSYSSNAQMLDVYDDQVKHEGKKRSAVTADIRPGPKTVKKAWQDYIKSEYDTKIKGIGFLVNKEVLSAEEVVIEAISDKTMNLYTRVVEKDGQTSLSVFGSIGYDVYFSEYDYRSEYRALQRMLLNFLDTFLPKYYDQAVAEVQANIADVRDEIADLEEDVNDNRQEIDDNLAEIEKLKDRNADLQKEIVDKERRLESMQVTLDDKLNQLEAINAELSRMEVARIGESR